MADKKYEGLLNELLKGCKTAEDVLGQNGVVKQLTKALLERMLEGELTHHLGYEKHDPAGHHSGNSRNGKTSKKLKTDRGESATSGRAGGLNLPPQRGLKPNHGLTLPRCYILLPDQPWWNHQD